MTPENFGGQLMCSGCAGDPPVLAGRGIEDGALFAQSSSNGRANSKLARGVHEILVAAGLRIVSRKKLNAIR